MKCRFAMFLQFLGEGISLFPNKPKESKWEIIKTKIYDSGMLKVDYQKQNK